MKKRLLNTSVDVLHADETTERVITLNDGDKKRQKCYVWLYATSMYDVPIYIYEHKISREEIHPQEFLKNYSGYLVCDDYPGYENINNVELQRCWYHAKKKYADFIKAIPSKQKKNSEAIKIHNMISEICKTDKEIHKKAKSVHEVKTMRESDLQPMVLEYFDYIEKLYLNVDKTSALGKAINYSIKNKADLCRFFEDAHIPLTNNLAERGIKPFVIIRKNALFSFTENGSQASCILLSIVQTAKMNLLKPDEYLKYVLERIDDIPIKQIGTLLPWSNTIPKSMKYSKKDTEKDEK